MYMYITLCTIVLAIVIGLNVLCVGFDWSDNTGCMGFSERLAVVGSCWPFGRSFVCMVSIQTLNSKLLCFIHNNYVRNMCE